MLFSALESAWHLGWKDYLIVRILPLLNIAEKTSWHFFSPSKNVMNINVCCKAGAYISGCLSGAVILLVLSGSLA